MFRLHSSYTLGKVMLKILQDRLQQYMNQEFPYIQAEFRKARGTRDQIANIRGSQKKEENSRKSPTSASLTTLNPLTVWITTNWKFLKEMGIPDHLTCLLSNLYAGREATVRIRHGTMDWFRIGKGVHQGYILSPCLFNLYAEYIMWNARLDEAQAEIKIARKNINKLRYVDDHPNSRKQRGTWESLDEGERGEWKAGFKHNIQKTKIMASSSISSCK